MPIFDLFCKECGHEKKDELIKYGTIVPCPVCKEEMTRVMPSFNFKMTNSSLTKHLRKWGNDSSVVPPAKDNGVRFDKKKRT